MAPDPDWLTWYQGYGTSPDRQARLRFVQSHISRCLGSCPPGAIGVISICAGDARDLIGVLSAHQRAGDVTACLVENNEKLVARGSAAIESANLGGILTYVVTDATLFSAYASVRPATLTIAAGVLGNLRPTEVSRLIEGLPSLCRPGGFVIWTRHRLYNDGPAALPRIRNLFREVSRALRRT
jgi:Putative methyltransferase